VVVTTTGPQQWTYQPAPDLERSFADRLSGFPREPDLLVYALRSTAALLLRGWLRSYHRLKIVGKENLPTKGSFVLVSNHSSHLDALCLLSTLPLARLHRAFPAAAEDYFFTSLPRSALAGIFINAMPFGRQTHLRHSLDLCRALLANSGNVLILFPEGTRSTTGEIGEFRPGIGMLAAGTDVPIIPCGLVGAGRAWPKGTYIPRPRRVRLIIGKPRDYSSIPPDKDSSRRIAAELRDAVRGLICG
jgi:1-acyl-sn-glycerol-3-phosphate acyltransferase